MQTYDHRIDGAPVAPASGRAVDPAVGFGGCKMSRYSRKGSLEHVESFLYRKAVYMNLGG